MAHEWIERYGDKAVLFGQLFGPARTWISYPAGALGMDVKIFALYTAIGGAVYCTAMVTLSFYFTDMIRRNLNTFTRITAAYLIVTAILGVALLVFLRRRRARPRESFS